MTISFPGFRLFRPLPAILGHFLDTNAAVFLTCNTAKRPRALAGTIGLEALDATVVYALVPNTTLESMVRNRARSIARTAVTSVNHTMMLEGQGTTSDALEDAVELYADQIRDRDLWQD